MAAMLAWVVAACAAWTVIFTGLLWVHTYMQHHRGWRPLAETLPWLTIEWMLAILTAGYGIAAVAVMLLGNRGRLPGTSNQPGG